MARSGTPQQITEFLSAANLRELDWMLVAHRMQDQEVYQVIIKALDDAKLPISDLWAYSLKHRDEPAMKAYLSLRDDLVGRVGPVLNSPLLEVEPIERRSTNCWSTRRWSVHGFIALGDENEILNPTFLEQYRGFVRVLGFSGEDRRRRTTGADVLLVASESNRRSDQDGSTTSSETRGDQASVRLRRRLSGDAP